MTVDPAKFLEWVVTYFQEYSGPRWAFKYKANTRPQDFFSAKYLEDFYSWVTDNHPDEGKFGISELHEIYQDQGVQYLTHCSACKQPTTYGRCNTTWCVKYMK